MVVTAALFASKRLQRVAAAVLCLATAQLLLTRCAPEPVAQFPGVRVAVTR
jgi:hypothetical protein